MHVLKHLIRTELQTDLYSYFRFLTLFKSLILSLHLIALWARGKLLSCDVTVPDTYADSYLTDTATIAGAAANKAAITSTKEAKYRQLANSHYVCSSSYWNWEIEELGQRIYQPSLKTQEKQVSCFSGCPWLYNGEMRSPSSLSQHFHHKINVAVVIVLFFDIFCLQFCAFGL